MVGLSGVGKTRLVQALFDARIGSRPLAPSLAVYTNMSDNPDPQPMGLASDLLANRMRAVLIVDNCPIELHHRLSDLCAAANSTVSVLTVEYDVRDDQPEGTQVVTLDTSSPELIEKLIRRRYPYLSEVNARTIADASGGNARIAIALAGTVGRTETIARLSDDELFQRLFRQRHVHDNALLIAAQVCSLVYSFEGEALAGDDVELSRLALLADQKPRELYRHVGELLRRDLVQQRGVWRAVLPHAIANRLAARALEDTPYDLIDQQLVTGGMPRLARSFSRRQAFLHEHPRAVAIVERWLAPAGLLGDVGAHGEIGGAMFENIAPVSPEATLAALERLGNGDPEVAVAAWRRHGSLLHSLAYDKSLFERSALLLARASTQSTVERDAKEASDIFISLFTIHLSGTHASIDQRLEFIEKMLKSSEEKVLCLGLLSLSQVLEATHFTSSHIFEFGARSRDYGYSPKGDEEVRQWYGCALEMLERLAFTEEHLKDKLRGLVAENFRGLWTSAQMYSELEILSRRFAADGFWREGWVACSQTMSFDKSRLTQDGSSRLASLLSDLKPSNLPARVRAVVLGDRLGGLDLEEIHLEGDITNTFERQEAVASELGEAVAGDKEIFAELLSDLLRGGNRTWAFGGGLAKASEDRRATWASFMLGLGQLPLEQRDINMLRGFLAEIWENDRDLVHELLDVALDQSDMIAVVPLLQSALRLDDRSVERLKRSLNSDQVPVWVYRSLANGRATEQLSGKELRDLLLLIAARPDGLEVAVDILFMRFHADKSGKLQHDPKLLSAGRELLRSVRFRKEKRRDDYKLAVVVRASLIGPEAAPLAAEIAGRLSAAVAAREAYAFENDDLLKALLSVQPVAVLDTLFAGHEDDGRTDVNVFDHLGGHRPNPADEISCEKLVIWCDQEWKARYILAASFVSFTHRPKEGGPLVWSDHAKALLAKSPDPRSVLAVFIRRFRPMRWSDSRAAIMEANALLLDSSELDVATEGFAEFVAEEKGKILREAASERQRETQRDKARDERFE
ncbi:hypothetical protein [Methylobacterium sp. E-045]|uniref:hypothetical protein n=1 Tax=Methylobacterium sp. E-045 TaxID=2836575 RepID=UPI001FB9FF39|nr:hypothetical protein [Methylobacterium sp. E-045]